MSRLLNILIVLFFVLNNLCGKKSVATRTTPCKTIVRQFLLVGLQVWPENVFLMCTSKKNLNFGIQNISGECWAGDKTAEYDKHDKLSN